jgi:hypothetical protein
MTSMRSNLRTSLWIRSISAEVITFPSKCSDGSTSGGCCLALNSYFTSRIFQPSSLHMQLTSSEARTQRLK